MAMYIEPYPVYAPVYTGGGERVTDEHGNPIWLGSGSYWVFLEPLRHREAKSSDPWFVDGRPISAVLGPRAA